MSVDLAKLLAALDSHSAAAAASARDALAVALPALTPEQAAELTPQQRARLYADLQFAVRYAWPVHRDQEYVVALIGAIPLIGGLDELDALQQIAAGKDAALLAAAAVAAERLAARLRREEAQGSLLRPADEAESLLRPSDGTPRVLRAVHPPEDEES